MLWNSGATDVHHTKHVDDTNKMLSAYNTSPKDCRSWAIKVDNHKQNRAKYFRLPASIEFKGKSRSSLKQTTIKENINSIKQNGNCQIQMRWGARCHRSHLSDLLELTVGYSHHEHKQSQFICRQHYSPLLMHHHINF